MAKRPTRKQSSLGLTNTVMAVAAKKEIDHAKEEKVSIKQGDVTKCGFTVKEVMKDGRLLISSLDCAKIVNRGEIELA